MMCISWISNERVRAQTQLKKTDLISHKREKTEMARARSANGRQQTAKTSCTLRYKRFKEKAGKTMKEVSSKEDAIQQDLKSIGMTCRK